MVPWLRRCTPNGGSLSLIPSQDARSYMLQDLVELKSNKKLVKQLRGRDISDCKCPEFVGMIREFQPG